MDVMEQMFLEALSQVRQNLQDSLKKSQKNNGLEMKLNRLENKLNQFEMELTTLVEALADLSSSQELLVEQLSELKLTD